MQINTKATWAPKRPSGMTALLALMAVSAIAALSGCTEGHKMSYDSSRAYLNSHMPQLTKIVAELGRCRPSTFSIQTDGTGETPSCTEDEPNKVFEIINALKANDILAAYYKFDPTSKMEEARFLFSAQGLGVSGGGTWIFYETAPSYHPETQLSLYESVGPIDAQPHHWFWVAD